MNSSSRILYVVLLIGHQLLNCWGQQDTFHVNRQDNSNSIRNVPNLYDIEYKSNQDGIELSRSLKKVKPKNGRPGAVGNERVYENRNSNSTRVIGGTPVRAGTYPWFARATKLKFTRWNGCGGSLVSREFVLTAAHCIKTYFMEDFSGYEIGALCSPFSRTENCGQRVERLMAKEVFIHPDFDKDTFDNDLALVRLDGVVSEVKPVAMDLTDIVSNYNDVTKLWVAGFGTNVTGDSIYPTRLSHAELTYVSNDNCKAAYGAGHITPRMMCASQLGFDACQGDSGGPLFDSARGIIVGVTSWGIGCASERYPGVYSKISSRSSWIKRTICSNSYEATKPSFCFESKPPSTKETAKPSTPRRTHQPSTHSKPTSQPTQTDLPPSSIPSHAPFESYATFSPTSPLQPCLPLESRLSVIIHTDYQPFETSWNVTNLDGDIVMENDEMKFVETTYRKYACILKSECFLFKIIDSYGDGITSPGRYSVLLDGIEVSPSTPFKRQQQFYIGGGSCDMLTLFPTPAPTVFTLAPTPMIDPCGAEESRISVTVFTDQYPYETKWIIEGVDGNAVLNSDTMDITHQTYRKSICVPNSQCYKFTIIDSYGDGFSDKGFYSVKWNGSEESAGTSFLYSQSVYVGGNACDSYTLTPTVAPVPATFAPTAELEACSDVQARVVVTVYTDPYPNENYWRIRNMNGNLKLSSDPFLLPNSKYSKSACFGKYQCYIFEIFDDYGDGLFSSEGYSVTWDGVELNRNQQWAYEQYLYVGGKACDSFTQWPTASPTTTMWPTSVYLSSAPTPELDPCPEGTSRFAIILHTDDYPEETSWKLEDMAGNVLLESEIYAEQNSKYTQNICIPSTDCYQFTMLDSYGDGILSYNGYYLMWNGEKVQSGNPFFQFQQKSFFGADDCNICGPGKRLFTLELQTDGYGGETFWDLKKTNKKGLFRDYIWNGYTVDTFYKDNEFYVEKYCVPKKQCYKFIFSDSYGDGLCCSVGQGHWKIKYGDKVIRSSSYTVPADEFPKYGEYSRKFGKCAQFGF